MISIGKTAFSIKFALPKITLINSRIWNISAFAVLYSSSKLTFIVGAISKFLFPVTLRCIINPVTFIMVALKWIIIASKPICFIISYRPFIHTSVIVNVSALPWCCSFNKGSFIIWAILEIEFAFTMKLIIFPFSQIKPSRYLDLLHISKLSSNYFHIIIFKLKWSELLFCFFGGGTEKWLCSLYWNPLYRISLRIFEIFLKLFIKFMVIFAATIILTHS